MATVVVTGGSRGIGAATVAAFAARGDKVYFLYEKDHAAAAKVREETGATAICCDVADKLSVEKAFAQIPDVDVLIAGHHGSKYSTSEELLRTVKPETVIISVGRENYYGHPAPELLQRLADFGCTIYRTDLHGTVVYRK